MRVALGGLAAGLLFPPSAAAGDRAPRVVTLFQGATDTAVALGVPPCAVVESWLEKPVYRYLRPELSGVRLVGLETQPSLEDIALLEPDLIVASGFRHGDIAPLLRQLAPVVMVDQVYEFKRTLARMGEALNRQRQAQQLLDLWQRRVAGLRQRWRHAFGGRAPRVSVLDIRADHVRSYLPGSFPGSVLTELGFDWPAASRETSGAYLKISSKESLSVVNADLFFVFLRAEQPAIEQHYRRLQQHPLWQRMQAPRQGRVWQVDGVAWSLSGGILGANRMLDDLERILAQVRPA